MEEDSHQHSFSLHELEWKIHSADPTLLSLYKTPPPAQIVSDDAEVSSCLFS